MNQKVLEIATKLKEEIENSPEVLELNRLNSLLESNEEIMKLAYRKDVLISEFEDAIKHFGDKSKEAKEAQKKLYEAKLALDSNELVKQYNAQYKKVREIYDKINERIFSPFNLK